MKKPLIVLTGPTAVGKTSLSIALANEIGGEIVSADSMQVYRYLNIGSAKITKEEMKGVPHHLIDVLDPFTDFNVVLFQKMVKEVIEGIYERGHIPIIVGGTGFYIQAVLYNVDFCNQEEDDRIRKELESFAKVNGDHALHEKLKEIDPVSYETIHENNRKRTIRALEFFYQTGEQISLHNEVEREKESAYNSCYFVLTDKRELLYERIEERVDEMMKNGLLEEVKSLKEMGLSMKNISMQGIGYKEILSYLNGECSLEEAVSKIKLNTRHFAKRQLTWFRREKDVIEIPKNEFSYNDANILAFMKREMFKKGII